jgi:hypothetical protein
VEAQETRDGLEEAINVLKQLGGQSESQFLTDEEELTKGSVAQPPGDDPSNQISGWHDACGLRGAQSPSSSKLTTAVEKPSSRFLAAPSREAARLEPVRSGARLSRESGRRFARSAPHPRP